MPSAQLTETFALGGLSFSADVDSQLITFTQQHTWEIALPAGQAVTSWVKTDSDTAACNLSAGHGQTNGKYDVYWTEAGVKKCRYGVDGTIATNALSLDGGAGDSFPASATTGIVVCKQVSVVAYIDGDNLAVIGIFAKNDSDSASRQHWDLQDSGGSSIEAGTSHVSGISKMDNYYRVAAMVAAGVSNPFTGNVIEVCKASNSSVTAAGTLYILAGVT
jgi:hypothetical protein